MRQLHSSYLRLSFMIKLNVRDETSTLEAVVLGIANHNGGVPKLEEAYDPKSIEHIRAGTYPAEEDMIFEMEAFHSVFEKHGVEVYRPKVLEDCNQIFTRDIAFVIDDYLIEANILPRREQEFEAIDYVLDRVPKGKVIRLKDEAHIEGGDVMLYEDYIFVGTYRGDDYPDYITARTNMAGGEFF